MIHHGVHGAAGNAEEESWGTELAEVAQVVAPVGLREDGHAVACRLERPPDDRGTKRRMVDIGVASDQHHVHLLPSQALHLLQRYRQKMPHITLVLLFVSLIVFSLFEIISHPPFSSPSNFHFPPSEVQKPKMCHLIFTHYWCGTVASSYVPVLLSYYCMLFTFCIKAPSEKRDSSSLENVSPLSKVLKREYFSTKIFALSLPSSDKQ